MSKKIIIRNFIITYREEDETMKMAICEYTWDTILQEAINRGISEKDLISIVTNG